MWGWRSWIVVEREGGGREGRKDGKERILGEKGLVVDFVGRLAGRIDGILYVLGDKYTLFKTGSA